MRFQFANLSVRSRAARAQTALAIVAACLSGCTGQPMLASCVPESPGDWRVVGPTQVTTEKSGASFAVQLAPSCGISPDATGFAVVSELRACAAGPDFLVVSAPDGSEQRCVISRVDSSLNPGAIPE